MGGDTCVILIVLTNKLNKVLTHDKYFKLFSPYGKILRILIFERTIIWKTFIEYDTPESAIQARQAMNGNEFGDDIMKMNVYNSPLKVITLQENNSSGIGMNQVLNKQDYTIVRQKIEEKSQKGISQSNLIYTNSNNQHKQLSQSQSPIKTQMPQNVKSQSINKQMFLNNSQQFINQQPIQQQQSDYHFQNQNEQTYNLNYDMIRQQSNLYQEIQQSMQRTNQLMYMLGQDIGEQQYQLQIQFNSSPNQDYNIQHIEKQQQLIQELKSARNISSSQLDEYQKFLSQWHNTFKKQNIAPQILQLAQNMFPDLSQISMVSSFDGFMKTQIPQKKTLENSYQEIPPEKITLAKIISSSCAFPEQPKIQLVKSIFDGDSTTDYQKDIDNLLNDDHYLLIQASQQNQIEKDQQLNQNLQVSQIDKAITQLGISKTKDQIQSEQSLTSSQASNLINQQSHNKLNPYSNGFNRSQPQNQNNNLSLQSLFKRNNEAQQSQEQDFFECFQVKGESNTFDTKYVMPQMNVDINEDDDSQSVLAQIERQIQQNTYQKSSNSVNQIDQLIIKSKVKQNEQQQMNNFSSFSGQSSPVWMSAKSSQQIQLYEDVTKNSDPSEYINPLFLKVLRKSKVIYANWFDKKIVTLSMLINMFSAFGNIDKMIYLKERSSVLVQYKTQEHSTFTKDSLNDIMFYGQQMKIFYSNYEQIYLKTTDKDEQEEYYQGSEETDRIRDNISSPFNSPSDTIIINNLNKESCSQEIIYKVFEPFGRILKHKFIQNLVDRNSCTLKYENVETALIVLANLYGTQLDGRSILISFSKQRL